MQHASFAKSGFFNSSFFGRVTSLQFFAVKGLAKEDSGLIQLFKGEKTYAKTYKTPEPVSFPSLSKKLSVLSEETRHKLPEEPLQKEIWIIYLESWQTYGLSDARNPSRRAEEPQQKARHIGPVYEEERLLITFMLEQLCRRISDHQSVYWISTAALLEVRLMREWAAGKH